MAAIVVAGWTIGFAITQLEENSPGWWSIALDIVSLVAVGWLALHSRLAWMFFIAAANVAILAVHFVFRWLHLGEYGYVTALNVFGGYLPLLGLAIGVWSYERAKKKGGH